MTVSILKAVYSRGEVSPRLHARTDLESYANGLATCRNFLVMRQGGLKRRRGTRFIWPLRDESEQGRLIRFEFDEEQAYAILFNDSKIRFFTLGGIVTLTPQNITGITKANPAVVTYSGADNYANNDRVALTGVVGMTEVNNREFTVANVSTGANTFELSGINSTGYTTWASGGTVAEIYEIDSPYFESDIADIKFTQSGDTIYLSHPSYAPRKLVRTSETSWALTAIAFQNGPWLDEDEQGTVMTPASTGSIVPKMTNNTSPSGTASDSASGASAYKAFDQTTLVATISTATSGYWAYDFAASATKIADAYWIRSRRSGAGNETPTSWTFDGYDGSNWVTLDARSGETLWGFGEVRYYTFLNVGAYQSYRLNFVDNDGGTDTSIEELGIHQSGDEQTAFNLTASAITGINDGAGFKTTDVDRTIRLLGTDAGIKPTTVLTTANRAGSTEWRWAKVVSRTSSTVVTIRLYGQAFADLSIIAYWQMSSWSVDTGFPSCVAFFDDRLTWARSEAEEKTFWASQNSDYENHGISNPAEATDGINATLNGGRLNRILWLAELDSLIMGTPSGIRVVDAADPGQPFSNSNIRQRLHSTVGTNSVQPVHAGSNLIYADRFGKHLHELTFSLEGGGYGSKELTILSEHLYTPGVTEMTFQEGEDDIAWSVLADGTVAALTYEPEQEIAGCTEIIVAGGGSADATVESVTSIPASGGDDLYMIVERTINGSTRRYVEYMAPQD